jgi:hypothetical protein
MAAAKKEAEKPVKEEKPKEPKLIAGFDPKTRLTFGTFQKKVEKTVEGKKITETVETEYDVKENNPKRRKAGERFAHYRKNQKLEDAVAAGITPADVKWDLNHGFIKIIQGS